MRVRSRSPPHTLAEPEAEEQPEASDEEQVVGTASSVAPSEGTQESEAGLPVRATGIPVLDARFGRLFVPSDMAVEADWLRRLGQIRHGSGTSPEGPALAVTPLLTQHGQAPSRPGGATGTVMPVMKESEIVGVALPQGLVVIDSGATEAVGSPEAVQQLVDNV